MAQIVLPLVVLGTAYLVSNTNDNDITENMSTITQTCLLYTSPSPRD